MKLPEFPEPKAAGVKNIGEMKRDAFPVYWNDCVDKFLSITPSVSEVGVNFETVNQKRGWQQIVVQYTNLNNIKFVLRIK